MDTLKKTKPFFIKALKHHAKKESQKTLAASYGASSGYINQIIQGIKNPGFGVREKLAEVCGYKNLDEMIAFGRHLYNNFPPEDFQGLQKEDQDKVGDIHKSIIRKFHNKELTAKSPSYIIKTL